MFKQKPNSHLSNMYGCPKCGEENSCGYSREDYIKKCGESNSKLYLVKFEKDKEVFYKIGITKQAINRRFKRSKLPYYYELIKYVEGNASYIFDLLLSVINVSVQTVDIVGGLPRVRFE